MKYSVPVFVCRHSNSSSSSNGLIFSREEQQQNEENKETASATIKFRRLQVSTPNRNLILPQTLQKYNNENNPKTKNRHNPSYKWVFNSVGIKTLQRDKENEHKEFKKPNDIFKTRQAKCAYKDKCKKPSEGYGIVDLFSGAAFGMKKSLCIIKIYYFYNLYLLGFFTVFSETQLNSYFHFLFRSSWCG